MIPAIDERELACMFRPEGGGKVRSKELRMRLFADTKKLRSHTVKHLLDTSEFRHVWGLFAGDSWAAKSGAILQALTHAGCPYFQSRELGSPPCSVCLTYVACGAIVAPAEALYLKILGNLIRLAAELPRYAVFFDAKYFTNGMWLAATDSKVVICAIQEAKRRYCVATAYSPRPQLSWQVNLSCIRDKLFLRSRFRGLVLHNATSWHLSATPAGSASGRASGRGTR